MLVGIELLALAASSVACGGGLRACGEPAAHEDPAAARLAVVVPRARVAYVSNNGSDSLSLLDLDAPGSVHPLSLDLDARREAPHHLAIDPAADRLYVALAHPREAAASTGHAQHGRSAIAPGELLALDLGDLHLIRRSELDESPGDLVLSQDRVLVTHFDLARAFEGAARGAPPRELFATLQVWDAPSGRKLAERSLCVAPHGIAVSADGATAYVACYGSDELAIVDLRSDSLATEKLPLGAAPGVLGAPRFGPYSVTLSADQKLAVVAELEGQELRVFELANRGAAPRRVGLGARAMLPCFTTSTALLVPLAAPDGLARVDIVTGVVERRAEFDASCMNPHAVACRSDGRAFVVCEGDHVAPGAVLEIDPRSLAPIARWDVGVYPDAVVFGSP